MPTQEHGRRVGIPWYTRATYSDAVAAMEDRDRLPATYDRWLRAAERVAGHAFEQGLRPVRAYIDATHFAEWCRDNGLKPDGAARRAFAQWVAEEEPRVPPRMRPMASPGRADRWADPGIEGGRVEIGGRSR